MPKGDFVGEFELYVLLALARLGDDAYGVRVRQTIEARTGRDIAIGAIYATLGRLEDKQLIRHWLSDPQPVQGGRARKHYALTPSGTRALKHSTTMLTRMMAGRATGASEGAHAMTPLRSPATRLLNDDPKLRFYRFLASRAAPPDQRADLIANLDDEWRERRATVGDDEARRWYRRQVLRSIGPLVMRRIAIAARPAGVFGALQRDVRFGARLLRRTPGFTAAAVLALALGIGATAATFSVVNAVLLKPLPYGDANRLVVVMHQVDNPVSRANFLDWQRTANSFQTMAAAEYWTPNLGGTDASEKIYALHMTPELLPMLGVAPAIGRAFGSGAAGEHEAVIAHGLWQRIFGGDPGIIGRHVTLDGDAFTIVGVMPPVFQFAPFWATRAELWAPLVFDPATTTRDGNSLRIFARLKTAVTLDQARLEMTAITARLEAQFPGTNRGVTVTPLKDLVIGHVERPLVVLLGAVAFVLLIACANVAHMLLARSAGRETEVAVRTALGAGRARLVRQFLTESVLLSFAGGGVGLLFAMLGVRLLVTLADRSVPRIDTVGLDARVLGVVAAISVLTAVVFGLVPALKTRRPDLTRTLRDAERGSTGGRRGQRWRRVLIASEVALSVTLLIGAGLMIRSFIALRAVDPGFVPDHVVSMAMSVTGSAEAEPGRRVAFYQQAVARTRALPGVVSASAINHIPIAGDLWGFPFFVQGQTPLKPGEAQAAAFRVVLPGYFATVQLPLRSGRDFTDQDTIGGQGVVIVNEFLARGHWPGEDAIGKRLRVGSTPGPGTDWLTVVGVAKNAVRTDWAAPPAAEFYLPLLQSHLYRDDPSTHSAYMTLVVRAAGDPAPLVPSLRAEIRSLAKDVAVSEVLTMREAVGQATAGARFLLVLLGVFAGVALVLAGVGIYGVMSYAVSGQRQEIGIRLALGATPRRVVAGVIREGMIATVTGTCAGVLAALMLSRGLTDVLFGVSDTDALTFCVVSAVLFIVAMIACYLPARSVTHLGPLDAMRPLR